VSPLFPFDRARGAAVYVLLIIALAAATSGGRAQSAQPKPAKPDAPPPQGQEQTPPGGADANQPRFRAGTNFVRVDAYPSMKGVAVRDLTADDFQVLEDGVVQKVESFEHVEVRGPGPDEARHEPNNPREARAIAESTTGRLFVVFLDTYHTEEGGSHRMQRVLVNLLNKVVGPDDMYAVMTPDMSAADISFARKTDVMEDYLAKYWFWGQRERLWPEDPVEQHYFECYPEQGQATSCGSPLGPQQQSGTVYRGIAREMVARRHEKKVLDALTDLARYLRGIREERKAVIAISNGWLLFRPNPALERHATCEGAPGLGQPGVGPDGRLTSDRLAHDYGYSKYDCDKDRRLLANIDDWQTYQDLIDDANRSNVTFYPVDSRGLAAMDNLIIADLPPNVDQAMLKNRIETLRTLATDTDGIAVVDTNDLEKGLRRVVDDLTSYYLLGYYSTNGKNDGKFRKITVRVKRPGVDVRARRGYRAATQDEIDRGREQTLLQESNAPSSPMQMALNALGSARPGIPFRTSVSYAALGAADPGGEKVRLWALAELDSIVARQGEWLAGGSVGVAVTLPDGTELVSKDAPLAAGQHAVAVDLGEIDVPAGEIVVRTRAKPQGDGLPYTDTIRLAGVGQPGRPLLLRRGPTTGIKYVPTANLQFQRTERLRVDLPMGADAGTPTAEVLDRAGKPIAVPVRASARTEDGQTWASAELSLAPLAAGDYLIRLKAGAGTNTQEVLAGFRLVP
jgi:VWFA-related protein